MVNAKLDVVPFAGVGSWLLLFTNDEQRPIEVRRPGCAAAAGLGRIQRRVASAVELAETRPGYKFNPCVLHAARR